MHESRNGLPPNSHCRVQNAIDAGAIRLDNLGDNQLVINLPTLVSDACTSYKVNDTWTKNDVINIYLATQIGIYLRENSIYPHTITINTGRIVETNKYAFGSTPFIDAIVSALGPGGGGANTKPTTNRIHHQWTLTGRKVRLPCGAVRSLWKSSSKAGAHIKKMVVRKGRKVATWVKA